MPSPARTLAFDILRHVEQGAWAGELLHAHGAELDPRDRALAAEIVLGTIRHRRQLDFLVHHYSARSRFDTEIAIALRMGIYQLRYLERIPTHAAVSESVSLVRRARKASAAGLVNAVLRKVTRDPIPWPGSATEFSLPDWLWSRWRRNFGEPDASTIARTLLNEPLRYIRVPPGREPEALALGATETGIPGCFRIDTPGPVPFRLQDISSQTIVPLLQLRPGMRLLDLCAGAGGKTAHALETPIHVTALDIHLHRLRQIETPCHKIVADSTRPLPFTQTFHRILVDAPCSGTGTIARNPEIRWRVQQSDLASFNQRQRILLNNAASHLVPGGILIYATCSLEPEENESVVRQVLSEIPDLDLLSTHRRLPGLVPGDGFFAAVLRSKEPASH
ncbi:MAG: hypothetical protein FJW20_26160 [Acidimicrobiia bacterium]|nr:hypothetical protein [Acidimicrobiia bacterium]